MEPFDFNAASFCRRPSIVVNFPVVLKFAVELFPLILHSVIEVGLVVLPPDLHSLTDVSHASVLLKRFVAKKDLRVS